MHECQSLVTVNFSVEKSSLNIARSTCKSGIHASTKYFDLYFTYQMSNILQSGRSVYT